MGVRHTQQVASWEVELGGRGREMVGEEDMPLALLGKKEGHRDLPQGRVSF